MSLYSSFYPAEYAKDVTGAATSAIWLDIDNHVPAISHQIGTRKSAKIGTQNGLTTLKDNCIYQCWHTVWHT